MVELCICKYVSYFFFILLAYISKHGQTIILHISKSFDNIMITNDI